MRKIGRSERWAIVRDGEGFKWVKIGSKGQVSPWPLYVALAVNLGLILAFSIAWGLQ